MPTIKITVTEHQMKLAQHKYVDVDAFATGLITGRLDQYGTDLSNRLVQRALDAPSADPVPMDRTMLLDTMFNEEGYQTAAEVDAAQQAAQDARTVTSPGNRIT